MLFKKSFLFFLVCFTSICLHGQALELAKQTRALFDEDKELQWVKHFKGRLNDYNDVAIVLGYDGNLCKGIFKYLRSGDQFKMEGFFEKKNLFLKEIDHNGNISGYVKGVFKQTSFEGTWSNFDNSIGSPLEFKQVYPNQLLPSHCGDNKWMRRYTAIYKKQIIELSIQKLQGDVVSGTVYVKSNPRKNRGEFNTYKAKGNWTKEEGLTLRLIDDYGFNQGKLNVPNIKKEPLEAFLTLGDRKPLQCVFSESDRLNTDCIEYGDYYSMYDVIYPKTSNLPFNTWIEKLVRREAAKFNDRSTKVSANLTEATPEKRATIRSNGWFEIGFFNDNILSGILLLESTVAQGQRAIPINFDLTNSKRITFEDIFRKEYEIDFFEEEVIRIEFQKHALFENQGFKKWIKTAKFPHMVLLRNGIHFSSNFNPIYGRQGITIPYDKLDTFLKKDTWVDFSFRK